jgi:triacylglycerol lipase
MIVLSLLFLFPFLFVAPIVAANSSSPPTVKVLNGSYYGAYSPTYGQHMFLGIHTPCHQSKIFGFGRQQAQPLNTTWSET